MDNNQNKYDWHEKDKGINVVKRPSLFETRHKPGEMIIEETEPENAHVFYDQINNQ